MDEIDLTSKKPLSSRLTKSRTDTQKSLVNQGLFLLYLDAPYRDLERTFILRAIKNIEI